MKHFGETMISEKHKTPRGRSPMQYGSIRVGKMGSERIMFYFIISFFTSTAYTLQYAQYISQASGLNHTQCSDCFRTAVPTSIHFCQHLYVPVHNAHRNTINYMDTTTTTRTER